MVKYRGKHEGRTRGKYTKAMLQHTVNNSRDWLQTCWDISAYLGDISFHVNYSCQYEYDIFRKFIASIHLAGASVGVEGDSYYKKFKQGVLQYQVELRIVSKDNIDDVIEKIKRKLPYKFEHLDASKYFWVTLFYLIGLLKNL